MIKESFSISTYKNEIGTNIFNGSQYYNHFVGARRLGINTDKRFLDISNVFIVSGLIIVTFGGFV